MVNKTRLLVPLRVLSVPLIIGLLLILGVGIGTVRAQQAAVTCSDPVDKWYDCWQRFSTIQKYADDWCSDASPTKSGSETESKRDQCKGYLFRGVNFSPSGISRSERCNDLQGIAANKDCYVILRTGGAWYAQLKKYGDDCGGFAKPDPDCADKVKQDFLKSKGWIDPDAKTGLSNSIDQRNPKDTAFIKRISAYIRWLIVGIGVLAVFSLVIAGIQYTAAQNNPQAVAAAKGRINNVVIGILIYFVMFAALQWLIPGGLF